MSVSDLFVQLRHINPIKANSLNNSDRNNSRRLIRAIEIAGNSSNRTHIANSPNYLTLTLTLIAPIETLKQRISERVTRRISNGAVLELNRLITKYSSTLPSFTACGYQSLIKSPRPEDWIASEVKYAKAQLTWFRKYCPDNWIDISIPDWRDTALKLVKNWYNSP